MKRTYTQDVNGYFEDNIQSFQYNILQYPNSLIGGRLISYLLKEGKVEAKITGKNGADESYQVVFTLTNNQFTIVLTSKNISKDNLNRIFERYVRDLQDAKFLQGNKKFRKTLDKLPNFG